VHLWIQPTEIEWVTREKIPSSELSVPSSVPTLALIQEVEFKRDASHDRHGGHGLGTSTSLSDPRPCLIARYVSLQVCPDAIYLESRWLIGSACRKCAKTQSTNLFLSAVELSLMFLIVIPPQSAYDDLSQLLHLGMSQYSTLLVHVFTCLWSSLVLSYSLSGVPKSPNQILKGWTW
jgi:hypothetical protein